MCGGPAAGDGGKPVMPAVRASMPAQGCGAAEAAGLIRGMVERDGDPCENLGTFVTTAMEPEAEELLRLGARINIIDQGEYPSSVEIHDRCLSMIARLWNAPLPLSGKPTGTATVGSSEACMLAGLAMKWRWRDRQKAAGRPAHSPNLVIGSNYQICWGKFCRYFDVELRAVPCSEESLVLTADAARKYIDEDTIGICAILGSTFNGEYEDVAALDRLSGELRESKGWEVPVHVDAASGGFIAPFTSSELAWDFRLPNVCSINASGHKYGMVYAGIGWLVFRAEADLPRDLVFHHSYLSGGEQESLTLNFSKGAGPILQQYYQFIRLGWEGYAGAMKEAGEVAEHLRNSLLDLGNIELLDKGHMPMAAFKLRDDSVYSVFDLSEALAEKGWKVPAYPCPDGAEHWSMMRVVVRPSFSKEDAGRLAADFGTAMDTLREQRGGFGGSMEPG